LDTSFSLQRSTHSRIQIQPLMTEHGLRTDKMDTKIFKNSGRDLRPKCRECPKLSVRTFLANLDHLPQRVPHGSLSRVSPLLGFQLRFLIKTIGTQAIRCHIACPVVESPVCHVPAPRTVPGKIQKQGRLSSFTESFFLEIDFRCYPQLA
jgi:hypothetical protein